MSDIRLNRYLADAGECARRKADDLIAEGKVKINGIVIKDPGAKVILGKDNVQVGSRSIHLPEKGIAIFNKPRSVVSSLQDPQKRKCVGDFLTKHYKSYFPVGRLDYESSGLLILTNDGELAHRLLHPKFGFDRVYEVRVRGAVREKEYTRLVKGIKLEDGFVKAKQVRIDGSREGFTSLTVVVSEGKNRMVRRMFDAIGHPVVRLKRIQHGPLKLYGVQGGEIKKLSLKDYQHIRATVFAERVAEQKDPKKQPKVNLLQKKRPPLNRRKKSVRVRRRA